MENGQKYSYAFTAPDGSSQTKEVMLDESDQIWVEIRHKHMKDCIEKLMADFNDFVGENAGFADKYVSKDKEKEIWDCWAKGFDTYLLPCL